MCIDAWEKCDANIPGVGVSIPEEKAWKANVLFNCFDDDVDVWTSYGDFLAAYNKTYWNTDLSRETTLETVLCNFNRRDCSVLVQ